MRAVIYARYSAGSGQTDLSIEGQVRECKKYIEVKGYDLQHIYADRHVSGLSTRGREEFMQLMADARAKQFDVVVCYDASRFARDRFDAVVYKTELRKKLGVSIEYATMNIEGPEGVLLEALMEGWNQYFSEELSRKTKRGMKEAASKGRAVGSRPPLGYRIDPETKLHIIDDVAAEAVREVFADFANGATMAACARKLNNQGYRTAQGKPFATPTIRYLLTNKKYVGVYADTPGLVPAIVTPDVFYAVQERVGSKRPKSNKQDYPLVGKLVCGCCGSLMTGTSGTGHKGERYYYYQCPKKCKNQKIRQDKLDQFVVECARSTLTEPETVKIIAHRLFTYQEKENRGEAKIEALGKSLAKTNQAIENLTAALAERPTSKALLDRLDKLEEQREELTVRLNAAPAHSIRFSEQAIADGLVGLLQPPESDNEKSSSKWILTSLVEKVILFREKVRIMYTTRDICEPGVSSETEELQREGDSISNKCLLGTAGTIKKEPCLFLGGQGSLIVDCERIVIEQQARRLSGAYR